MLQPEKSSWSLPPNARCSGSSNRMEQVMLPTSGLAPPPPSTRLLLTLTCSPHNNSTPVIEDLIRKSGQENEADLGPARRVSFFHAIRAGEGADEKTSPVFSKLVGSAQFPAQLVGPPVPDVRLVGTRRKAFSAVAPSLWKSLAACLLAVLAAPRPANSQLPLISC